MLQSNPLEKNSKFSPSIVLRCNVFPLQITSMSRRPISPLYSFPFSSLSRCVRETRRRRRRRRQWRRECGTHSRCRCPGFDVFHGFFRAPPAARFPPNASRSFGCVRSCIRVPGIFRGTLLNGRESRRKRNADRPSLALPSTYETLTHPKARAVSR